VYYILKLRFLSTKFLTFFSEIVENRAKNAARAMIFRAEMRHGGAFKDPLVHAAVSKADREIVLQMLKIVHDVI